MIVLSIDPGYERVGIAVINKPEQSKSSKEKEVLVYSGCFITSSKEEFITRLKLIGEEVENIIRTHHPDVFAIEKLYFGNNQKTAMNVSEVRGMLLYIANVHKMSIYEYTPLQIKSAITGDGRGDKRQVITMVEHLIKVNKKIKYDDEYDAIAIGLTCLASERNPIK